VGEDKRARGHPESELPDDGVGARVMAIAELDQHNWNGRRAFTHNPACIKLGAAHGGYSSDRVGGR